MRWRSGTPHAVEIALTNTPTVEVSWGEFIDKVTILEIKEQRLKSAAAVANVRNELGALRRVLGTLPPAPPTLEPLKQKLKSINETLWEIEDQIRAKEAEKSFDKSFVELARAVYHHNDERASLKREINALMKSGLVEEKQYTAYPADRGA
jgi:predicted  nucleic acid-binding Zn-ribbon protein